jgi:hypothetical protein
MEKLMLGLRSLRLSTIKLLIIGMVTIAVTLSVTLAATPPAFAYPTCRDCAPCIPGYCCGYGECSYYNGGCMCVGWYQEVCTNHTKVQCDPDQCEFVFVCSDCC